MRSLSRELRLPINDFGFFRQHGRWHRITRRGWKTLQLLADVYRAYREGDDENCLIRVRHVIRQLDAMGSAACLNFVIRRTRLGSLRLLAIWIRGRIGGTLGSLRFASFSNYPSEKVRKEVARACRRMSAWKQLTRMVHNERLRPDASQRVIRIATHQPNRPYSDRLGDAMSLFRSRGVREVPRDRHSENAMFVSSNVSRDCGLPPKSQGLIGLILWRIRNLVRRQH